MKQQYINGFIFGVITGCIMLLFLTKGVDGRENMTNLISLFGNKKIVGKNIAISDITEFYYTYATSTNPPDYQRYHFYIKNGEYFFYHEKREGNHWPLRESDKTVFGTVKLSEAEWTTFFDYLKGGKVKNREESLDSGDSGPWLYLYWKGDKSKCQEFSFESFEKKTAFEEFCFKLKKSQKEVLGDRKNITLKINDEIIPVVWENNKSVERLKAQINQKDVVVKMSMYGGFEQVGSLGFSLPREDKNINTVAGDIVLYSGNQIVVFYGSNSWSYTKLGKIIDKSSSDLKKILGNGDVVLKISFEN